MTELPVVADFDGLKLHAGLSGSWLEDACKPAVVVEVNGNGNAVSRTPMRDERQDRGDIVVMQLVDLDILHSAGSMVSVS